jgi:alpha-mannosidase
MFREEEYDSILLECFDRVSNLMKSFKEFKFTVEQVIMLEKLHEMDKNLFKKIRKYIEEGRIEVVNGYYCMIDYFSSQESTIRRNFEIGRKVLEELLGFLPEIKVAWESDNFGLPAAMPLFYSKYNIKYLAFRRGGLKRSMCEFIWRFKGKDVIAHFMPFGYRAGFYIDKLRERVEFLKRNSKSNIVLLPVGTGSWIVEEDVVKYYLEKEGFEIITPSQYFLELERNKSKLEIYEGDLTHLETYPDTLSSRPEVKIYARFLEMKNLVSKERLKFFFHDVICGTVTDENVPEVKKDCFKSGFAS